MLILSKSRWVMDVKKLTEDKAVKGNVCLYGTNERLVASCRVLLKKSCSLIGTKEATDCRANTSF